MLYLIYILIAIGVGVQMSWDKEHLTACIVGAIFWPVAVGNEIGKMWRDDYE